MHDAGQDSYCYKGTTVLKNRGGYRSQIDLDKFEWTFVRLRGHEALPAGRYDVAHYRSFHRHLFRDVYTWAGRIRTVPIAKPRSLFCQPEYIVGQMATLFEDLAGKNYFRDLEKDEFVSKLAHFLSEVNAIHPFREGNGRTQNLFALRLAD